MFYGLEHSGYPSAIDHWKAVPEDKKLKGWQPGALAFFEGHGGGLNKFGHIAIGDDKDGWTYTTDLPDKGKVGHKSVEDISKAWGMNFLGWTLPVYHNLTKAEMAKIPLIQSMNLGMRSMAQASATAKNYYET